MTEQPAVERRDSVAWAAAEVLRRLAADLGVPGLAATRTAPHLLARVDQHAADIRDTLADPDGRIPVTTLASYADGVRDVAAARGVDPVAAVPRALALGTAARRPPGGRKQPPALLVAPPPPPILSVCDRPGLGAGASGKPPLKTTPSRREH
jgi:hypothetical protein